MALKKKIKADRVVIITLALIGALCVVDNVWRLTMEIGSSVCHSVKDHHWSTIFVSINK